MYVFARSRQADPAQGAAAVAHAVQLAASVTSATGLTVTPWVTFASGPVGRVTLSTFVEHLSDLGRGMDVLAADRDYLELLQQGSALYVGTAEDSLVQLVHGTPSGDRPSYAAVVTADLANGHLTAGVMKGVEIAEMASRKTGMATMFGIGATGSYTGVAWFTPASDLDQLEAGQAALTADADWLSLVDGSGEVFNPGAAQSLYRRLG